MASLEHIPPQSVRISVDSSTPAENCLDPDLKMKIFKIRAACLGSQLIFACGASWSSVVSYEKFASGEDGVPTTVIAVLGLFLFFVARYCCKEYERDVMPDYKKAKWEKILFGTDFALERCFINE